MRLETIDINPADTPRATLIVLHGLGADGTDFLPMCDAFKLSAVGPVRYVMPRAPVRPVTINGGQPMRAWYDILGADLQRREDEAGLRDSVAQVHALLDQEVARGVPAQRIVLAGFSQGCAITLMAGLRYPQRLAGLAGLSGYLPMAASTAAERSVALQVTAAVRSVAMQDAPVFLGHGRNDGVVTMARGRAGFDALTALGHTPEWHDYPMEHSVCMDEVSDLNRWLLKVLA